MESVFKAALAEAVLADQFQQTCQTGLDRKHLQEMSLEKVKAKDIKKTTTKYLAGLIPRDQPRRAIRNQRGAVGAAGGNKLPPAQAEYDPDKIFKNNPGFDPVFMKV